MESNDEIEDATLFVAQGKGIGGYDLRSSFDQIFAFDYDGTGKLDHLVLYRPGTGIIWILKKNNDGNFSPVYREGDPGKEKGDICKGIGGYDLHSCDDQVFAFDYDGTGKLDHLVLYRPGTGAIFILKKNNDGNFSPVYRQGSPGRGIGGYDLQSPADQVFAFDYDGTGKLDHLVLYRPDTGTIWILKKNDGNFSPVYREGSPGKGIGGYDLQSPNDRVLAFDYDGTGKLDHLVLYRPFTGTIWILKKNNDGNFSPVYRQGGGGIGGYDLRCIGQSIDRVFAFDYDGTGKLDHLVLYRPGTGAIFILKKNNDGNFSPVYRQGDPGSGIGGYDLRSPNDRVFAFDYDGTGKLDHLVLYRPTIDPKNRTIWILKKNNDGNFYSVYQAGNPFGADTDINLIDIANIEYDLENISTPPSTPFELYHQVVTNDTDQSQTFKITGSQEVVDTHGWESSETVHFGISSTFKTGVPEIAEGEVTVSFDITNEYKHNDSTSVTKKWEFEAPVKVPAHNKIACFVTASRSDISVPFKLRGTARLKSGMALPIIMQGTYTGKNSHDFKVSFKDTTTGQITANPLNITKVTSKI